MQRNDRERWPEEFDPEQQNRSRPASRRNSASSTSRRNSLKREKNVQKISTTPSSLHSTPKRSYQKRENQNVDLLVTGKQILRKTDRANSMPGVYHRRSSSDSVANIKNRQKNIDINKKNTPHSSGSRETSLEDDMSLDLSQVSDFEDTNAKYGVNRKRFMPTATSTPKISQKSVQKTRSGSLQSQRTQEPKEKINKSFGSKQSTLSSRDSFKTASSAGAYRFCRSTDLDYSSVSPEYSGQSSGDMSPKGSLAVATPASFSQRDLSPVSCYLSWVDSTEADVTKTNDTKKRLENGEWNNFWANYNNSLGSVPMKNYYDQCPTPYRTETIDWVDLEYPSDERKRSPDNFTINNIIRNEGLKLTPRETQNMIKCAHILGNVLSKAIDRMASSQEERVREIKDKDREVIKKNMTLELKDQVMPLPVVEEKGSETVTTQTDISLPNTKSAPRIFENILRQLSRSSIDENSDIKEEKENEIEENNEDC
ncbi:hypothetical protein EVAR_92868_1 [Eumeta japonica]|uniref:Uncharacterized protein n=1 Tax=Eumeta variegata TaxID=151549 RepID=A0A4C1TCN4_EUMVA|nr:hypothetical protein EVAR_92868_1 [Eumeta japonica]